MARDHARLRAGIWSDPDFLALAASQQRAYLLALSQPGITYCGVLPYTPRRWARLAPDTTEADIRAALDELAARRFVVIDEDTEELLIRTFIKHDGVLKSPNVARSALNSWTHGIHSQRIRGHVLLELTRLRCGPQEESWEKGWPVLEPLLAEPLVEWFPEGFPEGFNEGIGEGPAKGLRSIA